VTQHEQISSRVAVGTVAPTPVSRSNIIHGHTNDDPSFRRWSYKPLVNGGSEVDNC
jgi:hypothetical protein